MKLKSLSYLLTLVMVFSLAGAGCKKKPGRTTPLPPPENKVGGDNPTEPGTKFGQEGETVGGGPTAEWDLAQFNQDRDALAAQTVYFEYDSFTVRSSEVSKVAAVAAALASDPNAKLLVEGHCDERGTEEYNRSLGERRALALREALAKDGLDPMRVRTISYGKDRKADLGESDAAHARNRRGVFVLLHPK